MDLVLPSTLSLAGYSILILGLLSALALITSQMENEETISNGWMVFPPDKAQFSTYSFSLIGLILFNLSGQLNLIGTLCITLMLVSAAASPYIRHSGLMAFCSVMSFLLVLTAALHRLPGIENALLFDNIQISEGKPTLDYYANLDKGYAGVSLLLWLAGRKAQDPKASKTEGEKHSQGWLLIPFYTLIVLVVGWLSGLAIDIKLTLFTLAFLICNLCFTVVAEEAFFRGVIQAELTKLFGRLNMFTSSPQWAVGLSLTMTSFLFGIAHMGGGWAFVGLATLAGFFYGMAYLTTRKLSAAIFTHFMVNLGHVVFLQYPV